MISARVRAKDLLRKLVMFGNPEGKQVDIEYPTEAIFAQMPSGVTLSSIEFSTWEQNRAAISGIKCSYSNSQKSPLFKAKDQLYHTQVINFDSTRKVARV